MEKTFKLKVPVSLDDISLKDYQKYVKVVDDNKDVEDQNFLALKMLNIFCGISMKEAYELPVNQMDSVINHLAKILSDKSKLSTRFKMTDPKGKTIEFGFIPNLDKMTLGEYIDAEKYMSAWETMHQALSVFYRPIVSGNKDFYKIEKYGGSDKYSSIMKDAPASVAVGAMLFFCNLGIELSKTTMDSLVKHQETSKLQATTKDLLKNGDGINQYTRLLKEMSLRLTELQKSMFIKQ
jgi:hypothetical protein